MSTYRPAGSQTYVYDFQFKGHRFCGPTGKTSKREADEVERQQRESARDRVRAIGAGDAADLTLDAATDKYWVEAGQHKSNAKALWRDLCRINDYFGADKLLNDIRDPDVAKLVAWRRGHFRWGKKKYGLITPSQVNRSTTEVLQRIFTRARDTWKVALPHAPDWGQHMLGEPEERVRELQPEEEAALSAAMDPDYEILQRFSLMSGLRRASALLKWSQVDFRLKRIKTFGKGGRMIYLPITAGMKEILVSRVGHHPEWVFTYKATRGRKKSDRGKRCPITASGLKTHFRRRKAKAKVSDYRWHDHRHTFATKLLRTTKNLKLVQRALHHRKIETTLKYAHVLDEEIAQGMQEAETADAKSREKSRGGERDVV